MFQAGLLGYRGEKFHAWIGVSDPAARYVIDSISTGDSFAGRYNRTMRVLPFTGRSTSTVCHASPPALAIEDALQEGAFGD